MSERDKRIECEHGEGVATYVCSHLRDGVACGYHASTTDDDPWPDAWCDRCEVHRLRAGSWSDDSASSSRISLICHRCYEEVAERNRRVPLPLKPGRIGMSASAIRQLLTRACSEIQISQDRANENFEMGSHERWAADYEAGRFMLTTAGRAQVVAEMQIVGSFSRTSRSWLWSWANETNEPHLVDEVARLRTLGHVRGIKWLEDEYHEKVDEVHCWELTSLACYILGYEACYRAPMDERYLFMILRDLQWAS